MALGTTSPWFPPLLYGPAAAAMGGWAVVAGGASWGRAAAIAAAGLALWTAVEYFLHRFAFHSDGVAGEEHRRHHFEPRDPHYVAAPALISLPIFALIFGAVLAAFRDLADTFLLCSGLAVGYILYEQVHYLAHHGTPRTAIGRFWRRYHMVHHFKDPDRGFGVTSPIWDYVFGTRQVR